MDIFTVTNKSSATRARCGILQTTHGSVETPIFMPVGTRGSVKGILPQQLRQVSAQMVLANTYHLLLRPGPDVVEALGGLHRFMSWSGPILTDSGGYQVFSLSTFRHLSIKAAGLSEKHVINTSLAKIDKYLVKRNV